MPPIIVELWKKLLDFPFTCIWIILFAYFYLPFPLNFCLQFNANLTFHASLTIRKCFK